MFTLNRVDHNKPDFAQFNEVLNNLKSFLNGGFEPDNEDWENQFNLIVNHQSGDGSFRIVDSFQIPSDAIFDFCNYPTVICNAIIMKAVLLYPEKYVKLLPALMAGLKASAKMGFEGHGYDSIDGLYDCIKTYCKAGLIFFLDEYKNISPLFSDKIKMTLEFLAQCIKEKSFVKGYNTNYETKIRTMYSLLTEKPVFTYGTLMAGERNHRFLDKTPLANNAMIYGFNLYNLGTFPGIRPSRHNDRTVKGEIYMVDSKSMDQINRLEDEGNLYKLEFVDVLYGEIRTVSCTYVYNHKARKETRIESGDWKKRK